MAKYRLKPEAVKFFKEKHATTIYDPLTWEEMGVDMNALEKVEEAYISHGIKSGPNSSSLGGWNEKDGTRFEFTIHFPSVKWMEHDKFTDGKMTRDLMNKIQSKINDFYSQFVNNDKNNFPDE